MGACTQGVHVCSRGHRGRLAGAAFPGCRLLPPARAAIDRRGHSARAHRASISCGLAIRGRWVGSCTVSARPGRRARCRSSGISRGWSRPCSRHRANGSLHCISTRAWPARAEELAAARDTATHPDMVKAFALAICGSDDPPSTAPYQRPCQGARSRGMPLLWMPDTNSIACKQASTIGRSWPVGRDGRLLFPQMITHDPQSR